MSPSFSVDRITWQPRRGELSSTERTQADQHRRVVRAHPEEEVEHGGGLAADEGVGGVAVGQNFEGEQLAELGIAAVLKQRLFKHLHVCIMCVCVCV
jgi:hypothetical protein